MLLTTFMFLLQIEIYETAGTDLTQFFSLA